jgi:hypothetical protein
MKVGPGVGDHIPKVWGYFVGVNPGTFLQAFGLQLRCCDEPRSFFVMPQWGMPGISGRGERPARFLARRDAV